MKYVNTGVVFQEVPDEVTLSINISNCPCHCIGCHSEYLWEDIGMPLNNIVIDGMLNKYKDEITCICLMGGDADTEGINNIAGHIRKVDDKLKIAWYSGRHEISKNINLAFFDYIKIGPYIDSLGGLNKETTNQRMYKVEKDLSLTDITHKFWKKKS